MSHKPFTTVFIGLPHTTHNTSTPFFLSFEMINHASLVHNWFIVFFEEENTKCVCEHVINKEEKEWQ